jgi:hypothetical protein
MTPQPQQQHVRWFGRSEDDPNRLLIIEDEHSRVFLDYPLREELYAVINSSRPAPAPEDATGFFFTPQEMKAHDAAIVAKAREDVLNQIEVVINEEMKPLTRHSVMNNREIAFRWVLKRIEHLRSTPGGERQ